MIRFEQRIALRFTPAKSRHIEIDLPKLRLATLGIRARRSLHSADATPESFSTYSAVPRYISCAEDDDRYTERKKMKESDDDTKKMTGQPIDQNGARSVGLC